MFRAILWSQWKWTRAMVLVLTALAFGMPFASLSTATNDVRTPQAFIIAMQQVGAFYPLLAALLGLLVAMAAWSADHAGRHTYALSLPVTRARYAAMRFGAGAVFVVPPVVALLAGCMLTVAAVTIPQGLHAYPLALTLRFAFAAMVAYSLFFAIASSTAKTAGVVLGAIASVLLTHYLLNLANVDFNLLSAALNFVFYRPGLLSVFAGRWTLIDV